MPDVIDFQDEESFRKAEEKLMEQERIHQEKMKKLEESKQQGMVIGDN
jgi:hypothetical protein